MTTSAQGKRDFSKIWTAVGIFLCVVLIPLLVVNLTLIVKSFTRPRDIPDFMGYKPFIVLSGSMEPAIAVGDLVITRETDPALLGAGDVIAYRFGENAVITHRIQDVTEAEGGRAFITRGDANNADDLRPVTGELVEGKLRWRIPGLGHFAMFLQTPLGLLLVAGAPLLLYVLVDLLRRRRIEGRETARAKALEEELARVRQQLGEASAPQEQNKKQGGDADV